MACLSRIKNIGAKTLMVSVANPIFPLSSHDELKARTEIAFEVLEDDAAVLYSLIGQKVNYHLEETNFWATLKGLVPCASTHPGLNLIRDRPTLRGVLVTEEAP